MLSPWKIIFVLPTGGICECAIFGTESPAPLEKPVLSKATVQMLCNEEGKEQCEALCRALALAARDNADNTLCQTLGHADKLQVNVLQWNLNKFLKLFVLLQPSVFARVCNEGVYGFTGVTSPKAYCCHEGKPLICNEVKASEKAWMLLHYIL